MAKAVNGSIIKLLFLVHYYPAADLSVFTYKLVDAWLVILLGDAANQHHFCLGIGPRVFSRDRLFKHTVTPLVVVCCYLMFFPISH